MRIQFVAHPYAAHLYNVFWDLPTEAQINDEDLITICDNRPSAEEVAAGNYGQRRHFGGQVERGAHGAVVKVYVD